MCLQLHNRRVPRLRWRWNFLTPKVLNFLSGKRGRSTLAWEGRRRKRKAWNFAKRRVDGRRRWQKKMKEKRGREEERKRAAEEDVEKELPERKAGCFGKGGQMEMDP